MKRCSNRVQWARYCLGSGMEVSLQKTSNMYCCKYCLGVFSREKNAIFLAHEELCARNVLKAREKLGSNNSYRQQIKTLVKTIHSDDDFVKFTKWVREYDNGRLAKGIRNSNIFSLQIYGEMCNIFLHEIYIKDKKLYSMAKETIFVLKDEYTFMSD